MFIINIFIIILINYLINYFYPAHVQQFTVLGLNWESKLNEKEKSSLRIVTPD